MKDLFTDNELKEVLTGLEPLDIAMCHSEIHRAEVSWSIGCLDIYADIVCVRKTIHDEETYEQDGYMRTDDGVYEYLFEVDEMAIYCDGEECSTYDQETRVVIPTINSLISISH
jgi:hypothetical protein